LIVLPSASIDGKLPVQATPAVGFSAKKSSLHHKASHLLFIKNKQK
jgi:hypothetical protein